MSPKAPNNGVQTVTTNYSFPYMRESNTNSKFQNFKLFIWDPKEKTFLNRTAKRWGVVTLFYLIFFSCLAAFFAICMKGLMATLDEKEPRWKLEHSLIGSNPGLGFRPYSNKTEEGSLIWYSAKNKTEIRKWVEILDRFLDTYIHKEKLKGGGKNQIICGFDKPPGAGEVCAVEVNTWSPCVSNESYSFQHSSPCFFLKLNRIYGWLPEYFDEPASLPEDMPLDLKEHIASLPAAERKQVWISCNGQDPADVEVIGPIQYIQRGFPSYYFPFENEKGYLSPLAVIRLLRPATERLVNVECRTWAKNIKFVGGQKERMGSVHFELMID